MSNPALHCMAAIAAGLYALAISPSPTEAALPRIGTATGQMYPDFYLPKLDGTFGRLSDYRGQKVVLIHFASW